MANKPKTDRDDALIDWIKNYLAINQYAPSVREVGTEFGLNSTSSVHVWLSRMRREARVSWVEGEIRTLHVVR